MERHKGVVKKKPGEGSKSDSSLPQANRKGGSRESPQTPGGEGGGRRDVPSRPTSRETLDEVIMSTTEMTI